MESVEQYLLRKHEELKLLNSVIARPIIDRRPRSVEEVIEQKFHLAAALKAEHELHDWAFTETAWTHARRPKSGPFTFTYDYQRADLQVQGPSFYAFEDLEDAEVIYTASGMAAISALLMALAKTWPGADLITLPNAYGETSELVDGYVRSLNRVELTESFEEIVSVPAGSRPRILSLDSSTSSHLFEALLKCERPRVDLIVFDTTCFSGGSGRIRRVLDWASRAATAIVLLRSHTKLDSLGVEYGRFGSIVFPSGDGRTTTQMLETLFTETKNIVRLFGGAAIPAHFPPFVGKSSYRLLTSRRMTALLNNSRRTTRYFSETLSNFVAEAHFVHGLYVTLASGQLDDENAARNRAAEMSDDLGQENLPLRHAGSFGFDFGAAEWAQDRTQNRYVVRLAVADLPTPIWDKVAVAVAEWWCARERQSPRISRSLTLTDWP